MKRRRAPGADRVDCPVVALRTALFLLCLALIPTLAAAQETEAPAKAKPLRVMAMGDSITVGVGSTHKAGYRLTFWNRMQEAGVPVNMVGGKAAGPENFDSRHQGYSGLTVYELSGAVPEKMSRYQPDVVLLEIGSNDAMGSTFSPLAFEVNFSILVDRILASKPDAKLLVSTLPPNKYGHDEGPKRRLNAFLKDYVEKRRAKGDEVALVDAYAILDSRRDMVDKLHPNDAGYEKLGDAFADALLSMLGDDLAG